MKDDKSKRAPEELLDTDTTAIEEAPDDTSNEISDGYDESYEDDEEDEPIVLPKIKQALAWFWHNRRKTLPASLLLAVIITASIPLSRYSVAGLVVRRDFKIAIIDHQTGVPVSDATVKLFDRTVQTDAAGVATFNSIKTGVTDMQISKNYYESDSKTITIGFTETNPPQQFALKANGRLVPINVINKITGKPIANVSIAANDSTAITDDQGEATIVLPSETLEAQALFTSEGYNQLEATIQVSQQVVAANTFQLVPSGNVYFLQNKTELYKAQLDGTSKERVMTELTSTASTVEIKASADWRYMVIHMVLKNGDQQLFVLDTETDEAVEIGGKDDSFYEITGWSGHQLHYKVTRAEKEVWGASRSALMRYSAESGQNLIVDQNASVGSNDASAAYENYSRNVIVAGGVLYAKSWIKAPYADVVANKEDGLYFLHGSSEAPVTLQTYEAVIDQNPRFELIKTGPQAAIIRYHGPKKPELMAFKDGSLVNQETSNKAFSESYPVYYLSPGGLNALWRQSDGQLVVGTQTADDGNVIETDTRYTPYGWLSDDYILVTRAGQLYILPSNGVGTLGNRLKIAEKVAVIR